MRFSKKKIKNPYLSINTFKCIGEKYKSPKQKKKKNRLVPKNQWNKHFKRINVCDLYKNENRLKDYVFMQRDNQ